MKRIALVAFLVHLRPGPFPIIWDNETMTYQKPVTSQRFDKPVYQLQQPKKKMEKNSRNSWVLVSFVVHGVRQPGTPDANRL